jgi:ribose-phosphate pyrophosphokinase
VIIPYFGYAKADKKDEPRVSIRARVCADCLEAAGADRVVTMDLHSPQVQGFFKKPVDHLYAASIFIEHIKSRRLDDFVIVAPDEGFAKNARYYSDKLGVPLVIGNKKRLSHDENAEIVGITGDARNKCAVIIDDFAISCGTLVEIAKALKENGALDIYCYVSHGLVTEKGAKALMSSHIKTFCTTDTIDNPIIKNCTKADIISVSELFGKTINIIHERESLSELFD